MENVDLHILYKQETGCSRPNIESFEVQDFTLSEIESIYKYNVDSDDIDEVIDNINYGIDERNEIIQDWNETISSVFTEDIQNYILWLESKLKNRL